MSFCKHIIVIISEVSEQAAFFLYRETVCVFHNPPDNLQECRAPSLCSDLVQYCSAFRWPGIWGSVPGTVQCVTGRSLSMFGCGGWQELSC